METSRAIEIMQNITKGAYGNIDFTSEVPVSAKHKSEYKIIKHTTSQVRFGIDYDNTPEALVIRSQESYGEIQKEYHNEWIIPEMIWKNTNTGNFLLRYFISKTKSHPTSVYEAFNGIGESIGTCNSKAELKEKYGEYIRPSYFKEKPESEPKTPCYSVNIKNIISINGEA